MRNNFHIEGETVLIECKRNNGEIVFSTIDVEDFPTVSKFEGTWYAHTDKKNGRIYIRGNGVDDEGNKKTLLLHRVITGCPSDLVVNHISGNSLDNRKENLEVVSQRENIIHGRQLVEVFVRRSKRFLSGSWFEVIWIIDNETEFPASFHFNKNEAILMKYILEIRQKPALLKYVDFPQLFKNLGYDFGKLPFEENVDGIMVPKLLEIGQMKKLKLDKGGSTK